MLDVWFHKGRRFELEGFLDHTSFAQPSARSIPLSYTSARPDTVHRSWPILETQRLHALNSARVGSLRSRARAISRYTQFFMRSDILAACVGWKPRPYALQHLLYPRRQVVFLRAIVGYHLCRRGLKQALSSVLATWSPLLARVWGSKGEQHFVVQVGYSLKHGAVVFFAAVKDTFKLLLGWLEG
jgi:hypothetical protein